ncbi:HAD hydrolase, IA, variant 1 family protein [Orientia chuto str. Dubai]|uniref:HAD hydrolase, IA, variant 1 family protein n=1 Tax=Orientia chuto str. Dubai TaxID=1359168 RepID=A0A0F3MNG2_9RICK|nr:TIGR01459 family HAD-type hydrolase [Candidatus Orientia mediorientalis]KJV57191.1 HAD hydrolase, IA, variant 1 family protein [Orientia chuto str. Dubai]
MPKYKPINLSNIVKDYELLLFDIYGVLLEDNNPYTKIIEAVNNLSQSIKICFISNTPQPAQYSSDRLNSYGINATSRNVYTSGEIARAMLKNTKKYLEIDSPIVFHLGPDFKKNVLKDLPIKITTNIHDANILLITAFEDCEDKLNQYNSIFQTAVNNKAICLCANPDTINPLGSKSRYCAGYFSAIYKAIGGQVVYSGKPYAEIFQAVLNTAAQNVKKEKILMIGDTLETDILGANNVGIDSALVLTGNAFRIAKASNINDQVNILSDIFKLKNIYPNYIVCI